MSKQFQDVKDHIKSKYASHLLTMSIHLIHLNSVTPSRLKDS